MLNTMAALLSNSTYGFPPRKFGPITLSEEIQQLRAQQATSSGRLAILESNQRLAPTARKAEIAELIVHARERHENIRTQLHNAEQSRY